MKTYLPDSPLRIAMDGSVLGTAGLYRKHQTGVYRALSELLRQFQQRKDLQLEFISAGRAPWLEFVTHLIIERDWRTEGWSFLSRRAKVPGLYPLLLFLARLGLQAKDRNLISETSLAGIFQFLGFFLNPTLASFTSKVYYSPAHTLPTLPNEVKRCITLYDMIPIKFPQWYDETQGFQKILSSINLKHDTVLAISESSRRDWLEYSGMPSDLTYVIPCGVSEDFSPRRDKQG